MLRDGQPDIIATNGKTSRRCHKGPRDVGRSTLRRPERLAGVAAALVLVIGIGFGRFTFAGLHPLMVRDHQISTPFIIHAGRSGPVKRRAGALTA